jgi:hypothetical protein
MEDVFMYVDEFGRLTSTPPEQRQEVNLDDIQLGQLLLLKKIQEKQGLLPSLAKKDMVSLLKITPKKISSSTITTVQNP